MKNHLIWGTILGAGFIIINVCLLLVVQITLLNIIYLTSHSKPTLEYCHGQQRRATIISLHDINCLYKCSLSYRKGNLFIRFTIRHIISFYIIWYIQSIKKKLRSSKVSMCEHKYLNAVEVTKPKKLDVWLKGKKTNSILSKTPLSLLNIKNLLLNV